MKNDQADLKKKQIETLEIKRWGERFFVGEVSIGSLNNT